MISLWSIVTSRRIISIVFLITFLFIGSQLHAQEIPTVENNEKYAIHLGYYAPFGLHMGIRLGLSYPFNLWTKETKEQETRMHRLDIINRVGYFVQPNIQRNFILDAALEYKWYTPNKKIHPKIGLGLGYMLARQNIGGSVNIANGGINFEKRSLHFFTPTASAGFEKNKEKPIGYYFNVFYGRKFTRQEVNSGFIGAELGLIVNIKKEN